MRNLGLRMKLAVGFGVPVLVLVTVSGAGLYSIHKLAEVASVMQQRMGSSLAMRTVQAELNERKTAIRSFLLSGDEKHIRSYETQSQLLSQQFSELEQRLTTAQGREMLGHVRQLAEAYDRAAMRVAELQRSGQKKEATDFLLSDEISAVRADLDKAVADFVETGDRLLKADREQQAAMESQMTMVLLVSMLVGLGAGIGMGIYIVRNLIGRVSQMVVMIEAISNNDLSREDMIIRNHDEISTCGKLLNQMKNNLREMIQSIAGTAEHVASASEEISSSATQQSQGSETQKDQTSQVATAMQEMSSTVLQVSENSNKAAESSRQAAETARRGGAIVEDTLGKMRVIAESAAAVARTIKELGKSSDQIGRIIAVIDDIADQTNLLALNAAIEAARAGEQGRGFAVVADEVRKLAERTTTATKEIAQMIKNIQDETKAAVTAMETGTREVEEGVSSTARAGDSLKEIIHMSEQVGEMIMHIATAATEQSSASEEINNNMEQIAKLVKESAVGAQQSAKACQDLSGLALDLQKMVGNFKLDAGSSKGRGPANAGFAQPARPKTFAAAAG